ncbi:MAG: hypothetical protein HDT47_05340 [Ruminococcaceae bacterium]|nr:hypothetical protein [Oscillospiraceae bacterium]
MKKFFTEYLEILKSTAANGGLHTKNLFSNFSGLHPDETVFWNVEGTDNAGFIIPIKRYSDIGELYLQSKKLINGQRDFLREITCLGISDKASKEKFCPVNKDNFFGCGSMKELYEHYLTIFEGRIGFNGFCDVFEGYLKDENGVLSVKGHASDNIPCFYGEAWKNRFVLIYDVTDSEASIIAALPDINESSEIDNSDITYRFEAMKMRKGETGWRLTDGSLFVN